MEVKNHRPEVIEDKSPRSDKEIEDVLRGVF